MVMHPWIIIVLNAVDDGSASKRYNVLIGVWVRRNDACWQRNAKGESGVLLKIDSGEGKVAFLEFGVGEARRYLQNCELFFPGRT